MYCTTQSCECSETSGRRFLTKDEKKEMLSEYKAWLDKESKGVAEAIAKLEA
jgi:hypothetical protein